VKTLTLLVAWLIGYYWLPCEVCGRGIAILGSGQIVAIRCSKRQHRKHEAATQGAAR
jgi:hypothetical protein